MEVRAVRHNEPLARQPPLHPLCVALELLIEFLALVLPHVGQVFEEQHHKDVVLVLRRVYRATKGVARAPRHIIDFVLGDCFHGFQRGLIVSLALAGPALALSRRTASCNMASTSVRRRVWMRSSKSSSCRLSL